MSQGDIHSRKDKIKNTLKSIEESQEISDHNKALIEDFKNYLEAQDLSIDRISRYMYTWKMFSEYIEWKIDEASKDDLIDLVGDINKDKIKDKELSEHTKMEYKKALKKMYSDFLDKNRDAVDGEHLTDFFNTSVPDKKVDPDRLPQPKHLKSMIKQADKIRDKAFMVTLWSSGGRIGEVLGLKWKDVKFKDTLTSVTFRKTKTGGSRTVPLRAGVVYLQELQSSDERSDDPEAYIFRSRYDNQMSYNAAYSIIDRARKEADVPERVKTNPHAWRKARATYMASQGANQAQLCEYFGWVQGSQHAAKYIRLAESDVEDAVLSMYDMNEEEEEQEKDLIPVNCPECSKLNRFESENCKRCGEVLTTSKLYEQAKIKEATDDLVYELAVQEGPFDEEDIKKKAKELVEDK
jgi:integrase